LLGVKVVEEVAGSCVNQEGRLTWSLRVLVKGHKSWNLSVEDSIRREEFLWAFLSTGEVLALVDHLYLVSFCLTVLYCLVVVKKNLIKISKNISQAVIKIREIT